MKKIVFFIVLIAVTFSGCDLFKGKKAKQKEAMEIAQRDSLRQDSIMKAKALELKKKQEEQARQDSIRRVRELEEQKRRNRFHVIAGSFKTPDYAKDYMQKMQAQGYEVQKLRNEYNFECISIYATDSYSKAFRKIKDIQAQSEEYVPLWVYEHK